ncbi:hypothetical protein RJ55_03804 [Drechmeria coniospora]|nr:hypothetical protein RJ55_08709 [Drechmeria coniospora]ODA75770.1 hypothetical protein RJ55_08703 [Drechmeria coniospora]ODA80844.1 hypothetical protein RJ55_03804 [Drechmeria coniospora]
MSEYWKSTPKYWCKHCSCYVRDTKLERQNHEATGRHQGAVKRALRDIHRNHEREERDKERAKQEIARLNGVVSGDKSSAPSRAYSSYGTTSSTNANTTPLDAERQRQREQLAVMGVAMPSELRPEMAMAGEWTVTQTRVLGDKEAESARAATGVRKRSANADGDEDEDEAKALRREEEDAVRSLFKKPRRWGRDSKAMPEEEDAELDALLSAATIPLKGEAKKKEDEEVGVKKEDGETALDEKTAQDGAVKDEPQDRTVKDEPHDGDEAHEGQTGEAKQQVRVKEEPETGPEPFPDNQDEAKEAPTGVAPVMFKKRKPKSIRTR